MSFSACISEEDINAVTFDTIENVKLEAKKENKGYYLYADLVLKNKNKIQFLLYDFKLKLFWKDEIIDVAYDAGEKKTKFETERVVIPIRGEIPITLVQKNLLSVAFNALTGKKNTVKTKGYIIAKKWMFKKKIEVEKTLEIGI